MARCRSGSVQFSAGSPKFPVKNKDFTAHDQRLAVAELAKLPEWIAHLGLKNVPLPSSRREWEVLLGRIGADVNTLLAFKRGELEPWEVIRLAAGSNSTDGRPVGSAPPDDGKHTKATISQGVFVYNGERTENIEPAPWRLLDFMEGKIEADLEKAYRHAINDNQKDWTDSAIKSMICKANAALEAVNYPARLSKPKNVSKIIWA